MILDAYQRTVNFLQGLYVQAGRESEALDVCRSWIEIADGLLGDSLLSESTIYCAIQANHVAGHLDQQMKNREKAQRRYRKALAIYEKAAEARIATGRLVQQKVELEMHLLELHYQIGSDDQAEFIFERRLQATLLLKEIVQPGSQHLTSAMENCSDASK
jgi:tetratricopeptide (TPR) repeat protein